ncbi:hypothetical protein CRG98_027125, partial [Punica granatum]
SIFRAQFLPFVTARQAFSAALLLLFLFSLSAISAFQLSFLLLRSCSEVKERSMAGARDRLLFRSFCLSRLSLSHGGWKASVLRYFSSNADGFGFNTGDEGSRKTRGQISRDEDHSAPPDPLPNRPLRGQQQPDWERPVRNNRSNMRRDRMRNDVSDDNFLEKFKLSFDK